MFILALIIGVGLGYVITLTGVGGGVLVIPTLSLVFNLNPSQSVGTASLYVALTKALAMFRHIQLRNIDYRISIQFLWPSVIGLLASAIPINHYLKLYKGTETEGLIQGVLYYVIIAVIMFALVAMVRETFFKKEMAIKEVNETNEEKRKVIFYVTSLITGILLGATGVGGGALIIPVLLLFSNQSAKRVVGNSILIAFLLALVSSFIYKKGGNLNLELALFMTVGSFLGIYLGGITVKKISEKKLKLAVLSTIFLCSILVVLLFFK